MSNIPSLKSREVVDILKHDGFIELRQEGSHLHLYHRVKKLRATVPMHSKDLKRKTLISIFRQANISIKDLRKGKRYT